MSSIGSSWVEVDIDAITHNTRQVLGMLKAETRLMAVVKADGYGHGAVEVAEAAVQAGATYVGVSTLEEGIELRSGGIDAPILLFNSGIGEEADLLIEHDLTATLASMKAAEELSRLAHRRRKGIKVHLQVETGFGRTGVLPEDLLAFMKKIDELGNIEVEGVYSHFATADKRDKRYAYEQLGAFRRAADALAEAGYRPKLRHICNSAATLDIPEGHMEMVRVGNLIYGQYPSANVTQKLDLVNTWQLKSTVFFVQEYRKCQAIGYGAEARVKAGTILAILPIGFADGFSLVPESVAAKPRYIAGAVLRRLAKRLGVKARRQDGPIRIMGKVTPIIGRVAMQHTAVDVTSLRDVVPGSVATVAARRMSVDSRVPKVYIKSGRPYKTLRWAATCETPDSQRREMAE